MELDGISMLLNNCIIVARRRKKDLQFVGPWHLLKQGHPMIDFEEFKHFFYFLNVENCP
jgi:hypothetical protein